MNVSEVINPKALAAYFTEHPSNSIPYLGEGLFPRKKKAGLDLSFIRRANGIPVSLKPSAFNTKATFRDRIGATKIDTEMPFFREGMIVSERDRQEIMRVQESNDPYLISALSRIFDDAGTLLSAAEVVPERMRWQLLAPTTGKPGISIVANGVDYTYDYDPDGTWKTSNFMEATSTDKWDAPDTADPLDDLRTAQDKAEQASGTRPGIAVMNRNTVNMMIKCKSVRSAILAQNATANIFVNEAVLRNALSNLLGVDLIVYNKLFKDESGATHSFVPDNMVTLLPGVPLGSTYYGTTPEEADLMGNPKAQVEIVNTGIALTTITNENPVNREIICSEIVLPSYEGMDSVAAIKVA